MTPHQVKPDWMCPEEFAHQLRCLEVMAQRYGVKAILSELETFTYTFHRGGYITWDITRAKAWVEEEIKPKLVEIPREQMQSIDDTWDLDQDAVDRADPRIPGICAPIYSPADFPPVVSYTLIDGVHRSAKAYREGQRFWAVMLPADASRDCILDATTGGIP